MSRVAVFAAIAAAIPAYSFAQAQPQKMEFEAASIRSTPVLEAGVKLGMHSDGAQVRFDFLSLRDLTRLAWQVKDYQVLGPDWIASERYTVVAKVPQGSFTEDQKREMLQNLLIDRFGLKYHKEKKDFAVYALEQGKNGIKMKETPPDANADAAPPKGINVSASGSERGVFVDLGGAPTSLSQTINSWATKSRWRALPRVSGCIWISRSSIRLVFPPIRRMT